MENDMLAKGSTEMKGLLAALRGKWTKVGKLCLAIVYLLASEATPPAEIESIEAALKESEVDPSSFQYVKKIKSLNVSLASSSAGSKSNIVDRAEKLYGQSLNAVTAGMKSLLSGGKQLALTRTVEALMEARPSPDVENYLVFDPRAPKSNSGVGGQSKAPFKEAIVFMIGGGNYIEYGSLQNLTQRQQPQKNIIYGTTEILSGVEFVEQLMVPGQKIGLGGLGGLEPSQ